MTFSEWMMQNGYSTYNSAAGRRQLQLKYGITGDSYAANMALWKKLKEEKAAGQTTGTASTVRLSVAPLQSKVAPLTVAPVSRPIVRPQLPTDNLPDDYTYYGQYLPEVEVVASKNRDMTQQELKQWIADNIDDPHTFFSSQYYKTIERIPESWWKEIYNYKDANGKKPYAHYRATKKEFDKNRKYWEQREADPEKREQKRRKNLEFSQLVADPERFFSPLYKKLRDGLSSDTWVKILQSHPEYAQHAKYSKYLPTQNTPEGRKVWSAVANADIAKTMDKAGRVIAPVVMGAFNPAATAAAFTGGLLTDEIVREASQNKYENWNDMFQDKVYGDGNDASSAAGEAFRNIAGTVTNPDALVLGTAMSGGINGVGTKSVTLLANPSLVKTAAQGLESVGSPVMYRTTGTRTYNIPATRGAGLGRTFRGGAGGKGLNPRGNYTETIQAIPDYGYNPTSSATINLPYVRPFAWGNTYPPYTVDDPTAPHIDPTPVVAPHVYNTAYSWGHPDFVRWWMENDTPENQGKHLWYPGGDGRGGRWVVIRGGGRPVLEGNYDASIPTGVYQRGTGMGAYQVQNQNPIEYDGTPIRGTELYFTPAGRALEPYELGEYQVFKRGGKMNYFSYIK